MSERGREGGRGREGKGERRDRQKRGREGGNKTKTHLERLNCLLITVIYLRTTKYRSVLQ